LSGESKRVDWIQTSPTEWFETGRDADYYYEYIADYTLNDVYGILVKYRDYDNESKYFIPFSNQNDQNLMYKRDNESDWYTPGRITYETAKNLPEDTSVEKPKKLSVVSEVFSPQYFYYMYIGMERKDWELISPTEWHETGAEIEYSFSYVSDYILNGVIGTMVKRIGDNYTDRIFIPARGQKNQSLMFKENSESDWSNLGRINYETVSSYEENFSPKRFYCMYSDDKRVDWTQTSPTEWYETGWQNTYYIYVSEYAINEVDGILVKPRDNDYKEYFFIPYNNQVNQDLMFTEDIAGTWYSVNEITYYE
ncbi:MAG: hypothetical protein LBM60_04250, partial [Clostridium sp.]|jgi:hypothetical protein|nr:hypothetical protein [Clostridium sp.]